MAFTCLDLRPYIGVQNFYRLPYYQIHLQSHYIFYFQHFPAPTLCTQFQLLPLGNEFGCAAVRWQQGR